MSPHNYSVKLNSLTSIGESFLTEVSSSNDTIVITPFQTNAYTSQVSETAILIINLEKKMTSRFDSLENELLNLKNVIMKNLKAIFKPLKGSATH